MCESKNECIMLIIPREGEFSQASARLEARVEGEKPLEILQKLPTLPLFLHPIIFHNLTASANKQNGNFAFYWHKPILVERCEEFRREN